MSIEAFANTASEAVHEAASIDFVFSNHSEENLSRVVEAVIASDGDIIAIEKVLEGSFAMGTTEEKQALSERMTDFIAVDSAIEASASEHFDTEHPFFTQLLDGLKGSGKKIVLIDMGTDDPGYYLHRNDQKALQAYNAKVGEEHTKDDFEAWNAECNDLGLVYQIASARDSEYREHIMADQLASLADENPGQKITVMAGASHTPMGYSLRCGYKVTRTFVPTKEELADYAPGQKMRFSFTIAQMRLLRLHLSELGISTLDENNKVIPNS